MKQYLSTTEVAEELGRSPSTVRRLIKCGRLEAVNLGTGVHRPRFAVPCAALDRFQEGLRPIKPASPRKRNALRRRLGDIPRIV